MSVFGISATIITTYQVSVFLIAPREGALERPCSKPTSFAAGDTMSTVDANEGKRIRNDYCLTALEPMLGT